MSWWKMRSWRRKLVGSLAPFYLRTVGQREAGAPANAFRLGLRAGGFTKSRTRCSRAANFGLGAFHGVIFHVVPSSLPREVVVVADADEREPGAGILDVGVVDMRATDVAIVGEAGGQGRPRPLRSRWYKTSLPILFQSP